MFLPNSTCQATSVATLSHAHTCRCWRAVAPMLAGALFAWSIQGSHHIPLDRHLVFYGSAAFLVMGALLTNRLPDKLNSQHSKS